MPGTLSNSLLTISITVVAAVATATVRDRATWPFQGINAKGWPTSTKF